MAGLTEEQVQEAVQILKGQGLTLRAIASKFEHLTYGDIGRILQGIMPRETAKRLDLGMAAVEAAPVCPVHKIVHVGRCPGNKISYKDNFAVPQYKLAAQITNRVEMTEEDAAAIRERLRKNWDFDEETLLCFFPDWQDLPKDEFENSS